MTKSLLAGLAMLLSTQALHASVPADSIGLRVIAGKVFILHKLDRGENLSILSKRYGCSVSSILEANNLTAGGVVEGTIIKVPAQNAGKKLTLEDYLTDTPPGTVGKSESVKPATSGTTTSAPKNTPANNTPAVPKTTPPPANPPPAASVKPQTGDIVHTVEKGQTLYAISRLYTVSVADIKKWNNLSTDAINAGQKLIIKKSVSPTSSVTPPPSNETAAVTQPDPKPDPKPDPQIGGGNLAQSSREPHLTEPAPSALPEPAPVVESVQGGETVHVVRRGESLYVIAKKYGTTVAEIKRVNKLTSDSIREGQKLIIPVKGNPTIGKPAVTTTTAAQTEVTNYREPAPLVQSLAQSETKVDSTAKPQEYPDLEVIAAPAGIVPPAGVKTSEYRDPSSGKTWIRCEEKGKAGPIEDFSTDQTRFYAFHRTLPAGTVIAVDYPAKNQSILVEVVNSLPASDPYTIRLSARATEYLMLPKHGEEVVIRYSVPK